MSDDDQTAKTFDFSSDARDAGLLDAAHDFVRDISAEAEQLMSGESEDISNLLGQVAGRSAVLIARMAGEVDRLGREVEELRER